MMVPEGEAERGLGLESHIRSCQRGNHVGAFLHVT